MSERDADADAMESRKRSKERLRLLRERLELYNATIEEAMSATAGMCAPDTSTGTRPTATTYLADALARRSYGIPERSQGVPTRSSTATAPSGTSKQPAASVLVGQMASTSSFVPRTQPQTHGSNGFANGAESRELPSTPSKPTAKTPTNETRSPPLSRQLDFSSGKKNYPENASSDSRRLRAAAPPVVTPALHVPPLGGCNNSGAEYDVEEIDEESTESDSVDSDEILDEIVSELFLADDEKRNATINLLRSMSDHERAAYITESAVRLLRQRKEMQRSPLREHYTRCRDSVAGGEWAAGSATTSSHTSDGAEEHTFTDSSAATSKALSREREGGLAPDEPFVGGVVSAQGPLTPSGESGSVAAVAAATTTNNPEADRHISFEQLETACYRVLSFQQTISQICASVGLRRFPNPLPHQERCAEIVRRREELVKEEQELRSHPPTGPSLEEILNSEVTPFEAMTQGALSECQRIMPSFACVIERQGKVSEMQRSVSRLQCELEERQAACKAMEEEIEQMRTRLENRAKELQRREQQYAESLKEHSEQEKLIQQRIDEVEAVGKKVSGWLKILDGRDKNLAAKEDRMHRVRQDLLRRTQDLRLYKTVAGRFKHPPPPPPRPNSEL